MLARKKIWKKNFVFGHNFLQTEIKQIPPETTLYAKTYLSKLKVDHDHIGRPKVDHDHKGRHNVDQDN